MGKSGAYRQIALTRHGLLQAQKHEERRDKLGAARSTSKMAPLIWSRAADGLAEISTPEDWEPGDWDSTLVADFDRHIAGARYDKRALASGKVAAHAFLQFPTDLKIDSEAERMMLINAVKFVNRMHGGDAAFHARLDRDEDGKHGVDVFFAPRFEKTTGRKGKEKTETWVSLRRFEKERAKALGLDDGPRSRGRMFQDQWFQFLRDPHGVGLHWAERGKEKLSPAPDRLEPEVFKLTRDREKLEAEKTAFSAEKFKFQREQRKKEQEDERQKQVFVAERKDFDRSKELYLEARSVFLEKSESERREIAQEQHRQDYQRKVFEAQKRDLDIEKLGVAQEKIRIEAANQSLARREAALGLPEAVEAGLSGFFDGRITEVKAPEEGGRGWRIGFAPGEDVPRWRQVLGRFWDATAKAIEPFQRLFQTFRVSLEQRAEVTRPVVQKSPVIRQNRGFERD